MCSISSKSTLYKAIFCCLLTFHLPPGIFGSGFGLELTLSRLEEFEWRNEQRIERLQNALDQSRIEMENLKRTFSEKFHSQERNINQLKKGDSGLFHVSPIASDLRSSFPVYRDGTNNYGHGGNWTVFQTRFDGTLNFSRGWDEYKHGFGDVRGEHWLGLEKLRTILNTERHDLLIVMEDFKGVIAYARYDNFTIETEAEQYVLRSLGTHSGIVGDSFGGQLGRPFYTFDKDNGERCAAKFHGGGWFTNCYQSHLNGPWWRDGKQTGNKGIHWYYFRGYSASLTKTKMMVRPYSLRGKN